MDTHIVYVDEDDGLKQAGDQSKEQSKETKEVAAKAAEASDESQEQSETDEESTDESAGSEELEAASDEETDEESDEQQEEKPKKQGGFKRKLNKLQTQLSAKEQEIEYWKQQALKQKETETQTEKPEPVKALDKPVRDDYESLEEYLEAVTEWKVEKRLADAEIKKTQESLKTEAQKKQETYQERLNSVKKELKDFDDVISDFIADYGDIKFSTALNDLILESEVGPKVIYELAKDKTMLDKLNSLSPLAAAKEFGKLEDKLSAPKEKQPIKVKTSAAPPLKTIAAQKAQVKKDLYDPDLSFEEFDRLMSEKEAKTRQQYRRY